MRGFFFSIRLSELVNNSPKILLSVIITKASKKNLILTISFWILRVTIRCHRLNVELIWYSVTYINRYRCDWPCFKKRCYALSCTRIIDQCYNGFADLSDGRSGWWREQFHLKTVVSLHHLKSQESGWKSWTKKNYV